MKRWGLAAAVAGLVALWAGAPVQAAEWCQHDPQLSIPVPGQVITVYVTEGVLGSQYHAALNGAKITYSTGIPTPTSVSVVVYDLIPSGSYGTFATQMVVSSKPYGGGTVYGSTYGTSGTRMSVAFSINPQKPKA